MLQNFLGFVVWPVMNDLFEYISVAPRWNFTEKVSALKAYATGNFGAPLQGACAFDDVWQIKQDAFEMRKCVQYCAEQGAITAANVHNAFCVRKIINCKHSGNVCGAPTGHCVIENPSRLRMSGKIVKERNAIDMVEGRLAGVYAVKKLPQERQNSGPPTIIRYGRNEPGASVRKTSDKGVF